MATNSWIGIANAIGFRNKHGGKIKYPQWFKDSLVCWYDPKKQGLTNDEIKKGNGTFLLKDFSGNKLDMTMHNFDGEGMSGMDGYGTNLNTDWFIIESKDVTISKDGLFAEAINMHDFWRLQSKRHANYCFKFIINVDTNALLRTYCIKKDGSEYKYDRRVKVNKNTPTTFNLPKLNPNDIGSDIDVVKDTLIYFESNSYKLRILPSYPDALVFDGVDDYGISENQPVLEDYTVIAKREWITLPDDTKRSGVATKRISDEQISAFEFERFYTGSYLNASFGYRNYIEKLIDDDITYMTKQSYNNISINSGTGNDSNILCIGKLLAQQGNMPCANMALYQFLLFNRTLTQDELDYVKYVVMKEPLPEPIAVYSAKGRSNNETEPARSVLPNLAPNGNHDYDIQLNNFNFDELGNWGGYFINLLSYKQISKNAEILENKRTKIRAKIINSGNKDVTFLFRTVNTNSYKLNIQGITSSFKLIYTYADNAYSKFIELRNGINDIPASIYDSQNMGWTSFKVIDWDLVTPIDITIELLPQYPDGLVFDGVDDFGVCEKFPIFTKEKGYTVIAKRKDCRGGCLCTMGRYDNGGVIFSGFGLTNNTWNFGVPQNIKIIDYDISFQTSKIYNNNTIKTGTAKNTNSNKLFVGKINFGDARHMKGTIYELHIFDHDLTPKEIEMYIKKNIDKDYVLPQPTE